MRNLSLAYDRVIRDIVYVLALATGVASAQVVSTSLSIIPHQGDGNMLEFRAMPLGTKLPSQWFGAGAPGLDVRFYKVFEVTNMSSTHPQMTNVTDLFINPGTPVNVSETVAVIPLKKAFRSDISYLVEADDTSGHLLDISVSTAPAIAIGDAQHLRDQLFLNANVPLKTDYPPKAITVVYDPGGGQAKKTFTVETVKAIPAAGLELALSGKLPGGLTNSLQITINGIQDAYGVSVPVSGTVASAPSAPTDATKAFLTVALAAIAATHTAPIFTAAGTFAPLHTAVDALTLGKTGFKKLDLRKPILKKSDLENVHFDPSVVFDVGSATSSSTNAITVPSEFIYPKLLGLQKGGSIDQLPAKSSSISVLNFMGGPRAEVDTLHLGLNLMGEGRLEWYGSSLFHTASRYQAKISALNPGIRSTLNLPATGFSITPYVQYDGGKHLTAESITNPTAGQPNVVVPTFPISRIYFGSQASLQYQRHGIAFDGSWVDLFYPETSAFTKNKVLQTRTVSGLQPHAKGTYTYAFDQEKHFAGTIAWENGRSAPAFAYLNKVTVGLTVTY
jgi:hypothetical protein